MGSYVLVHGMAHGAWCWEQVAPELERRGHRVTAVDLALTGLGDDAAVVADALDAADGPVTLVGHSYGGLVISRAADGRADVGHLVYVAAVLLDAGDVLLERAFEFPNTALVEAAQFLDDGTVVIDPAGAAAAFYGTCDPAVAQRAVARLRPTAVACLSEPPGAEPWRTIPSTYVLCEQDGAVHPNLQRWMSPRAGRVVTFDTDHSPFYSAPERLLEVLEEAAAPASA